MQITLVFDSLEEFQDQISKYAAKLNGGKAKAPKPEAAPVEDVAKVIESWEQEKSKPVDHAALNESAKKTTEIINQAEAKEEPAVTEEYRLEVRQVLYKLNKETGNKTAATDLIKTFGVKKLTDVPLSDLPALMKKAQEALNA